MTYTLLELTEAVKGSKSYSEVLSRLGKSKSGSSVNIIKNKILEHKIDISHFNKFGKNGKRNISIRNLLLHDAGFPPDPVPDYGMNK